MLSFTCNWAGLTEPLPHFWEHTVGSCHAPLALRRDWQDQLARCHRELGFRHVRFHGLLCDDMSTLVRKHDRLIYSFHNIDRIWDFLLSIGMRPFVELSFMPEALASGTTTVFHYRANVTPPSDINAWETLIHRLTMHWAQRYGIDEVRRWYFEVWNEPNLKIFWDGSQAEYFELYEHTVRAIKRVDDSLRVGGPATAKEEWLAEFLDYCERHRLPVDFTSTHHYPNDVIWYEDQDTETQLANSRRGLLREWMVQAQSKVRGLPLLYTEWNCSSNVRYPPQDEPYAAAFVVKTIMEAAGLVDAYSFWTFTDIFEEGYFPSIPFHGGFGLLNIHGIPKPTYRAFELLHRLGVERLAVEGRHETLDAWVIKNVANSGQNPSATIVLTNHALPRQSVREERVHFQLQRAPRPASCFIERIDEDHANPKKAWLGMGKPEYLRPNQIELLESAAALRRELQSFDHVEGNVNLELILPPHGTAFVTVEFEAGENHAGTGLA